MSLVTLLVASALAILMIGLGARAAAAREAESPRFARRKGVARTPPPRREAYLNDYTPAPDYSAPDVAPAHGWTESYNSSCETGGSYDSGGDSSCDAGGGTSD